MLKDTVSYITKNVYDVMYNGAYSSIISDRLARNKELTSAEKSYIATVSTGVVENWLRLEYYLNKLSKKKPKKEIAVLIICALYELEFMQDNKDYLTVNKYVEYAKKNYPHAKNFVNALLRNFLRAENLLVDDGSDSYLSIYYSHPLELINILKQSYSRDELIKILISNQKKAKIYFRVNKMKTTRDELVEILLSEGFVVQKVDICDNALLVTKMPPNITTLPSFRNGLYYIQDISSIMLINAVDVKGDERVLDVAAAPGGKSLGVYEKLTTGSIISEDIYEKKLNRVKENSIRLGADIKVNLNDASVFKPEYNQRFDIVLADVPCSGLGIVCKKPEIKYRKISQSVKSVVQLQRQIVSNVSRYVKPGGYMYYSTCTINPEENENIVNNFLKENTNFEIEVVKTCGISGDPYIRLLQSNGFSDGFFIAKLKRK